MNGHCNFCNLDYVNEAIATFRLYILSFIQLHAYDTDLVLKSGRLRQLNCASGTSKIQYFLRS